MFATEWAEPEMDEIREGIYLGSRRAESAPIEQLQEVGISHIVQVGTGDFMSPTHPDMLTYCCIRAVDFEGEDLLTKLKEGRVHSFIKDALAEDGKVLVHCFAGVSRSATTVISYLMSTEGLSFEDALVDLISKRGRVAPNRGFCNQLRILQDQCGGQPENYRAEMLRELKEELSVKQWLAILIRSKDKVNSMTERIKLTENDGCTLSIFRQRLEERKQLAKEGKYFGHRPPPEIEEDSKEIPNINSHSSAEEYGLELA